MKLHFLAGLSVAILVSAALNLAGSPLTIAPPVFAQDSQSDDGQKRQKDDGQQNQKDDGHKNQKDKGQQEAGPTKRFSRAGITACRDGMPEGQASGRRQIWQCTFVARKARCDAVPRSDLRWSVDVVGDLELVVSDATAGDLRGR